MRYVVQIPVRLGSKRVPMKNLRLLNGIPMVSYSIIASKKSKLISKIFLNSEGPIMKKISKEHEIEFYERPSYLLGDNVRQDEFNYDFLTNNDCENMVMVNPVSSLILPKDIDDAIKYYEKNSLDTLISVKSEKYQAFYKNKPINFLDKDLLPKTQDLEPVKLCAWSICIWNKKKFLEEFEKNGFAVFVGKVGLYDFDPIRCLKVSNEFEFKLAEILVQQRSNSSKKIEYYE